ncbi:hypothetical protein DU508_18720 [Pedobacter chinensis]|uniref:Uncharacterized protein n=1 Tax=Pedobacter chinensis TaxID=2282421 RepID=A0A369PUC3_9SPHI|nr:hypothetical protein DU508_18720 [Pedobacter chinensis]
MERRKRSLPLRPGPEGTGGWPEGRRIERQKGEMDDEKINHFLFGSQKKIPTFALPTETKGKQEIRWRMSRRSRNKDQNERKHAKTNTT